MHSPLFDILKIRMNCDNKIKINKERHELAKVSICMKLMELHKNPNDRKKFQEKIKSILNKTSFQIFQFFYVNGPLHT